MGITIDEKRKDRQAFLEKLYELTDGNKMRSVDYREVGKQAGLADDRAEAAAAYLVADGLASWVSLGGFLSITHQGVRAVEDRS